MEGSACASIGNTGDGMMGLVSDGNSLLMHHVKLFLREKKEEILQLDFFEIAMNVVLPPTDLLLYQMMPALAKAKENGTFCNSSNSQLSHFVPLFPF